MTSINPTYASSATTSGSLGALSESMFDADPSLTTDSTPSSTTTSGITSTKTASVWVDKPGLLPVYDVGVYGPNISSYGDPGNKTISFECINGCPLVVANTDYDELWYGVISNSTDSASIRPHDKFDSLVPGNNNISVSWINQDYVEWQNESLWYAWSLFNSEDGTTPIATSGFFEIHINDWDYNVGRPEAVANGSVPGITTPATTQKPSLSTGARAGIAVGVVLIACLAIAIVFLTCRRRRLRKRTVNPTGVHEEGIDNPYSKPELVGTIPANSGVPYRKPELETRTKILQSEISSSEGTALPYEGGTGAPVEPDREQEKQLVESERLIPHYMEVRESQTGEPSSPSTQTETGDPSPSMQRFGESNPTRIRTPYENLNTLKAQERELAHKMEVSESLLRLRAEHAALLDRIRIAEMREREVHGGG